MVRLVKLVQLVLAASFALGSQVADANTRQIRSPLQCPTKFPATINYETKAQGKPVTLVEGQVAEFQLSCPLKTDGPVQVTLQPGSGVALQQTTFSFNGPKDPTSYKIYAKLNTAAGLANGATTKITVQWRNPAQPNCPPPTEVINLIVQKQDGCTGQALGDPHMSTLDGVKFDFMKPGVFRLVDGRNFQIHAAVRKCTATAGCVYGVAIQTGSSIVRLVVDPQTKNLAVSKGSSGLQDLAVEKQKDKQNNYRVFLTFDPSSYIDINMERWAGTEFLDVTCRLSPFLLNQGVQGLLGNGNKNRADDVTNQDQLATAHKITGDNLFTCKQCDGLMKPTAASDQIKLDPIAILHQGYAVVPDQIIPQAPASGVTSRRLEAQWTVMSNYQERRLAELDQQNVTALCTNVLQSIPRCDKYVSDPSLFLNSLCVQDTLAIGDLKNVDDAKLAYLRECRRQMDEAIALDAHATPQSKQDAAQDRQTLALATTQSCPDNCNGRGTCLLNGCQCERGWTGYGCTIAY